MSAQITKVSIDYNQLPVEEYPTTILQDTTAVYVPINVIRKANIKLNERMHLLNIISLQEQNIIDYNVYINEQDSIIKDFQIRLIEIDKINQRLSEAIKREQDEANKWKRYTIGISGVVVVGVGILFLTK